MRDVLGQADSARSALHHRRLSWAIAVSCAGQIACANAEPLRIEPSVDARVTWTDNTAFEDRVKAKGDAIIELTPALTVREEGKRFRVDGAMSLTALTYARNTLPDRYLPSGQLAANLEAIDRFFFLEAGVVSRQAPSDLFAPQPDGASSVNTVTTTQYSLVPRFEGHLGGEVEYQVRSSNSWTQVSGPNSDQFDGAYLGEHSLRVARKPARFGWSLEFARSDTHFESGLPPRATIDSGRLILDYALAPAWGFGVRGGYETTNLVINDREQTIYGAQMNGRPTERTDIGAMWEKRFFGDSWNVHFNHRMPRFAWNIRLSRDVATSPQTFLTLPATDNVAALLDAAFTTRFPDAGERSRIVADFIARQGLPSSLATETSLFAQHVNILTTREASVAFLGARNSIALMVFSGTRQDLPDVDPVFRSVDPNALVYIAQRGASLTLSHRVSSITAVNVTAGYTRARGLGEQQQGQETKQKSISLQLTRQLTAKSTGFVGARVQSFIESGVSVPLLERAAFAGVHHRF